MAALQGAAVSETLISSWQSGETAVASYGETLSQNTSAFIGSLMGVEAEVWNLQAQADNTASSLAWMFAARADSLVNELGASYYAESNLAGMTNTLQQVLSGTLERGYNVSGILSSLGSITSAANAAAKAVESIGTGSLHSQNLKPTNRAMLYAYAGGTRATEGDLIVTDEEGEELARPVHIGNLINVQGNIDNSNIKQMGKIAQKAVDRFWMSCMTA